MCRIEYNVKRIFVMIMSMIFLILIGITGIVISFMFAIQNDYSFIQKLSPYDSNILSVGLFLSRWITAFFTELIGFIGAWIEDSRILVVYILFLVLRFIDYHLPITFTIDNLLVLTIKILFIIVCFELCREMELQMWHQQQ